MRCGKGQRLPRSETASPISTQDIEIARKTKELPRIPDFPRPGCMWKRAFGPARRHAQRPAKAAANRHRMFPSRHRKGRWRNCPTRPYNRVTGRRQGAAIRGRMRHGHRNAREDASSVRRKARPLSTELPARVDRGRSRARHGRVRFRMRADGKHGERRPETEEDDRGRRSAQCSPTETRDVDVVVVGAGVGGMAAALQAVEQGLSTVLLEKESVTGGTSSYAEGMFDRFALAAGSRRRLGRSAPEGHGIPSRGRRADEGVLRRIGRHHRLAREQGRRVHRVEVNLAHLRRHGRGFHEALGGGLPKPGSGRARQNRCEAAGHRRRRLRERRHRRGRIDLVFNARGVILTSGGYADNADMINEYTMHDYDDLTVMGTPERTGDGIRRRAPTPTCWAR